MLQVYRSGYYAWLKRPDSNRKKRRLEIKRRINEIFLASRRLYGRPKITRVLHEEGLRVGQKTVATNMRESGLKSRTVRKYKATTNSNHNHPVHENVLNQTFKAERPNQVLMSDIPMCGPMRDGFTLPVSWICLRARLSDGKLIRG